MKHRTLVLSCLAALVLALSGLEIRAADESTAYTVVIKRAEVKTTKADGSAWDINDGKPDLAVHVRNLDVKESKRFTTKTKNDTFEAEFDEPTTVKFTAGQTLEFEVVDRDVAADDSAGKITKKITQEMIKAGKLKFENFGQTKTLEVEFKKL